MRCVLFGAEKVGDCITIGDVSTQYGPQARTRKRGTKVITLRITHLSCWINVLLFRVTRLRAPKLIEVVQHI
jgi:hypothetical protein